MTTYYLLRVGVALCRVVPAPALYVVAGLAARVIALLPTPARAAARRNIAQVMGRPLSSRAVRRAAAQALRCQVLNYVDLMRLDRIGPDEFEAAVAHGDLRAFQELVAAGKGVIILSAHLGNVDLVVQWLRLHGYRVRAPMERLEPPRLDDLVRRQRTAAGLDLFPVGAEAFASLSDALRAGGVVALVVDRDIGGNGLLVDFFGAPARLPAGPALLALRTGAPLLFGVGRRLRDNRLYLTIGAPLYLRRTRDLRADIREGVRAIARELERAIAPMPEQWVVFEPVWPGGAAGTPAGLREGVA